MSQWQTLCILPENALINFGHFTTEPGFTKMKIKQFLSLLAVLSIWFLSQSNAADDNLSAEPQQLLQAQVVKTHAEELANKCKNDNFFRDEDDYILGPHDVLSISVLSAPELNKESLHVQPNGKIILDVLDQPLMVEGMTTTQLYCELTNAYSKILNDPRITLDLTETKGLIVYVTGAVMSPGSYEMVTQAPKNLARNMDEVAVYRTSALLSNVLVAAGGVSYNADLENITIENKLLNRTKTVNLIKLLKEGDSSQDLRLMKDDVVHVPRSNTTLNEADYRLYASSSFSPKKVPVKVFGYVNKPGLVQLDSAQSLNLLSAITAAGGYNNNSAFSPTKIHIFRPVDQNGTLVRFEVNPTKSDVTLFPNDIVYVPLNKTARVGLIFDYVTRMMGPAARAAGTYRGFTGDTFF